MRCFLHRGSKTNLIVFHVTPIPLPTKPKQNTWISMVWNNKRWNSIKSKDSVSSAADMGSTVTRGYLNASKGESLCTSLTWSQRRTKVVSVRGFSLHAEVRQLPWMNETEKLKDEGTVPASSFSPSVKALNWFWSSETKFGTRLEICNACFAVFQAQSRFTAAEIVCQIPDNLGSPAHCCECFWLWGGRGYGKDAPSPFISLQKSDREISKCPQEASTEMTSWKDQQGPLCSPHSRWMPAADQARTMRTAHFTVLLRMDSPQMQKRP